MTRAAAIRLAIGAAPIVLAYAIGAIRRPTRREWIGVLLAVAWNLWAVLAVNALAIRLGWWSFGPRPADAMGVPLEAWIGWVVLWGVVAPLVARRPIVLTVAAFLWIDLIAMPQLAPVVVLHEAWVVGEALAIGVALIPGVLLARWTSTRTHLPARAALQVVCSAGLLLWLVPSAAMGAGDGWGELFDLPAWQLAAGLQVALLPVALGMRAVTEFVTRGGGTPVPYDPPRRIVVSGPYAYVRNPMQLSMVALYLLAALMLRNPWLLAAAIVAVAYSAGLAAWHEDAQLLERFGDEWTRYTRSVRSWLPRWRPVVRGEATLLVAYSCPTCTSIGRWLLARAPVGLRLAPAEDSADPMMRRVTYVPADGSPSRGVAAVARALEHLNLGWAVAGWLLLLPGVVQVAQVVADVFGPGPQDVAGKAYDAAACSLPGR